MAWGSLWARVFALNAVVVAVAAALLLSSPATVSNPPTATEVAVVLLGVALALLANALLLRRAFAPLDELGRQMADVDLLHPDPAQPPADRPHRELRRLAEAYDAMLVRLRSERRESARRALAAQEQERLRVARELHDEVGQSLTGVLLLVEQAATAPDGQAGARLEEARQATRESLEDVRRIAARLRPDVLDDLGLAAAITALCTQFARRSGIAVRREIGGLPELTPEKELALYRIAQESLTNVARHSRARNAEVVLVATDGGVRLEVRDDGRGMNGAARPNAGGLRGMEERAILVDAALTIGPAPGGGMLVALEVPR